MANAKKLIEENLQNKDPYLDLGNCGLYGTEDYLSLLADCTHLKSLIFSNRWYDYEKRDFLDSQNKGEKNTLREIPPCLPKNLEKLVLSGYDIFDSKWRIQEIKGLENLQQLQILGLSSNQVSEIKGLENLQQLQILDLNSNQVSEIKGLENLQNLEYLGLSSNQVSEIKGLENLQSLKELDFENNPFYKKLPKEIQSKGWREILQYWLDTYGQKKIAVPIREAKVVFVGEGGSGKTSLMHLLLYGKKIQSNRTEKIEIHTDTEQFTYGKKQEKLTLRFWDFGGQDIMHATHKFFMSERTLYVLVSNGRKNEDEVLEDWLEMLKSAIGKSPVLLVVNQLDNAQDSHRLADTELQRSLPNLVLPVIETSWETQRGIEDLKNAITKNASF